MTADLLKPGYTPDDVMVEVSWMGGEEANPLNALNIIDPFK